MKKLTAEKCMSVINGLKWMAAEGPGMSIRDEYDIQAYELALKALEQQERLSVEPVAFTGSGSLAAIKAGAEGVIWGSKADAHPIELFARYPASFCQKCNNTGSMDSGGKQPWGEAIMVECDCQFEQQERSEGEWIEWGGGECPVPKGTLVDVRLRDGSAELSAYAWGQKDDVPREFKASYAGWAFWLNEGDVSDIIAYRIIPEQPTNQNGEQ